VTADAEPHPQAAEYRAEAPLPPAEANPRGSRRIAFVALAVILLASLGILLLLLPDVSTDDAQVDAHIPAIAPRVPGYVVHVFVNDNQMVRAGQPLVDLDPKDYQATVAQAEAAYAVAEAEAEEARLNVNLTRQTTALSTAGSAAQREASQAELARTETAYRQATTATLEQARANLAAKQSVNARAQSDLQRFKVLLASEDVSQLQFDSVATAARVAQAELDNAQQQVLGTEQATEIAQSQAQNAGAQLKRSQASLQQSLAEQQQVPIRVAAYNSAVAAEQRAKANLEEARLQLSYTHVVAPLDGQVTERSIEIGQYVIPGQQLMTVVPLAHVYVTANYKETQLAHVHSGQRVKIHADEFGSHVFWGTVDSVAASTGSVQALLPPQNATGNFVKVVQRIPVKIAMDPPAAGDPVLRPGMNVEAKIYVH
jgi:membrane fusion protein, multidrug efflux system